MDADQRPIDEQETRRDDDPTKRGTMRYCMGLVPRHSDGVDLLGDAHGAELGGGEGADLAREQEGDDQRADFAHDAEVLRPPRGKLCASYWTRIRLNWSTRMAPTKTPENSDGGQGADRDVGHLLDDGLRVALGA